MRAPALRRSRVLAVLVLLVSVTLCAAGVRASDNLLRAEKIAGTVGEQIRINDGWVRVDDVQVGQTIVERDEVAGRTEGMFVVLRVTVGATGPGTVRFGKASLVNRDRTYDQWSGVLPSALTGFSTGSRIVFEVDPNKIDELTVALEPGDFLTQYTQFVAVGLGITAQNAADWRAAGRGRVLTLDTTDTRAALR